MQRRKLALGLGTTLALLAVAVGALVVVAAADGPADPSSDRFAALSSEVGASLPALSTNSATATPTPNPKPTPAPPPGELDDPPPDVAVGGEQPLGPPPTSAPPGIPENVNASPQFLALKDVLAQEITAYAAQVGGIDVAIAVTDLQTGETISVGGNVSHRTGCTINMFALLAVVGEFEAGRADPQSVAYNINSGIGGSYPPEVKRFLQTVFGSHQSGVERAREMMGSWGMEASLFDHVPYYGDGTQNNLLTAQETSALLTKLYRGELFNPEWTQYTLERLRNIAGYLNYMLPGQLPASATVAHKIGYYWDSDGWVNNDAGIVTFTGSDGQEIAYAITYLSEEASTEYIGYSFGARLSGIVWDWFEAKYRLGTEPPPPPSPEPTPTVTPEPSPTPSPSPQPTPSPSPQPTPSPSPQPTPSPSPQPTPSPTPEPSPSPTPEPTPSPTPEPTPTP